MPWKTGAIDLLRTRLIILLVALGAAFVAGQFSEDRVVRFIKFVRGQIEPPPTLVVGVDGIPLIDYGTVQGVDVGVYKSPVQVGGRLVNAVGRYRAGDVGALAEVRSLADWILNDLTYHADYAVFEYTVTWPKYDLTPPWRSALAQSNGLQGLAEAYDVTKDERYLAGSHKLLRSFFVAVDDGGVTHKTEAGWWYEEYAKANHVHPYVLNGMMYTLLSLHRYATLLEDADAAFLFEKGLASLRARLPEFDHGGFSKYDLLGSTSGPYHHHHIKQLKDLHAITGDELFLTYSNRWATYDSRLFVEKVLLSPTKMTVAVLLLNWAAIYFAFELVAGFLFWVSYKRKLAHEKEKQPVVV